MKNCLVTKLMGAAVIAVAVAFGSGFVANAVISPKSLAENAFKIEVPKVVASANAAEPAAPAAAAATPAAPAAAPAAELPPIEPLMAAADPAKGQVTAKVCAVCHDFTKGGPNKVGPNLWGIAGAKRAHLGEGFAYSAAMKNAGGTWTDEALNAYLAKPSKAVPGNKMPFAGLNKPEDRANVIAFLHTLADK